MAPARTLNPWKKNAYTVRGSVAYIRANGSREATFQVDKEDLERILAMGSWHMNLAGKIIVSRGSKGVKLYLLRAVMDVERDHIAEPIDGNQLNGCKANIIVIKNEKRRWGEGNGAYLCSSSGKWRAMPFIDGKRVNLGRFDTEEEARAAILAVKPLDPYRGLIWDKRMKRYRIYGVGGLYLGSFQDKDEARDKLAAFKAGLWKPEPRTPGISWDSALGKWRANSKNGEYIGRFETKELALEAQRVYHLEHDDSKTVSAQGRTRNKSARS